MAIFNIIIYLILAEESHQTNAVIDARIAKSVADWFDVTCMVFLQPEDSTVEEIEEIFQEVKILFGEMKSVTVRKFLERTTYRYNAQRCSRMLHVIDGRRCGNRNKLEQMSHSVNFGGQIWLVFLDGSDTAELYFQNARIPFDSNFIIVEPRDTLTLRQVYRVSMDHDIRTAPFGNWSLEQGLKVSRNYTPYWHRKDLEGKSFVVSAIENWPLATLMPDNTVGGYFGRVWRELQERLNFSSVYVKPKDLATGFWSDGKWNGLIGMILRGEIDAAISEITMTPERLPEVDFLYPLYTTRYQLFIKSPGMIIQWDVILRPFRTEVWLTLLLWLGLLTILLSIGHRIGVKYDIEDARYAKEYGIFHCFFFVTSAFSQQANSILPKSCFCRLILAISYMFSMVALIIYSGILMSMVAVQKPSRPFDSLDSFLQDGTYQLQQIPGTDAYAYFSNSTEPVLQKIYQTLFANLPMEELPTSHRSALDRICEKQKIAHLGGHGLVMLSADELQETKGCQFIFLERPLKLLYLTMAVTKDSPYRNAFDYQLRQMFATGILNHFRQINFPLRGKISNAVFQPVSIEQTAQMNLLLVAGFIAAIFAFAGELALTRNRD